MLKWLLAAGMESHKERGMTLCLNILGRQNKMQNNFIGFMPYFTWTQLGQFVFQKILPTNCEQVC